MSPVPSYDPQAVEARWQERWTREHTNEPDLDRPRRPFYNLMMFPYPSAEGLHVGNMFAFTGADIYGRFKRLQGHDVFGRSASTRSAFTRRTTRSKSAPTPRGSSPRISRRSAGS